MTAFSNQSPKVMGVLNVTDDSFYPGSRVASVDSAIRSAKNMIQQGVDILDIGAESTRPGAGEVDAEIEIKKLVPIITELRQITSLPISVDTSKAEVMEACIRAGANMINDVRALTLPNTLSIAAEYQIPVVLMHMQGQPENMQQEPSYHSVVHEVYQFLAERISTCLEAGIHLDNIIVDPGFGFGKTPWQNLTLIKHLSKLKKLNCPILIGVSRKSSIGVLLGHDVEDRLYGSLALSQMSLMQGASIIRTHDVRSTKDGIKLYEAWLECESHPGCELTENEGASYVN